MKKYDIRNLVLLIDKKGDKDRFVIAERGGIDKYYIVHYRSFNDKYYLITEGLEGQEILDKNNYEIVGEDNTYIETHECFFTALDSVLKAHWTNFGFLRHKNLDENKDVLSRNILEDTEKYLGEYRTKEHFKGKIPSELTTSNIKYIEDKLNFELEHVNNSIYEEDEFCM